MHVVADENQRALVLLERADQRVDGADVQVRRRLVHQQQVRRIEQQLDQREPALFAAAQHAVVLNTSSPRKRNEPSTVRAVCSGTGFGDSSTLSSTVCLRIEHLDAMLREVTDPHIVPELARAGLERQHARENFKSVDLPAPFGPTSTVRCPRSAEIQSAITPSS